jgi:hypothetical protein
VFVGTGAIFLYISSPASFGASHLGVAGIIVICEGVIGLMACATLYAGSCKANRGLLIPFIIYVRGVM